jgi:thiamine kinase-like enzyme
MRKIKSVLKTQFSVDPVEITEIHGGLSTMNFKVETGGQRYFLKVYDKKKAESYRWTENIDFYMPILAWLNENTELGGRIPGPLKSKAGEYSFEDDENVYLLFNYIEGEAAGKSLTRIQLLETAEIIACLHNCGGEIPADSTRNIEDFSIPFCRSLERFISDEFSSAPTDIKEILHPHLTQLLSTINEVKTLSEKMRQRNNIMVLCHTDAHGYNLIQGERLALVDWEGMKLAPAEADLVMFTKKEYRIIFFKHYRKLRPEFRLDAEMLSFYIKRRKIEDIWDFIRSILYDGLSCGERKRDLAFLSGCMDALNDLYFEL